MNADPVARTAYDRLAYGRKLQHVRAIECAKKPETRRRRIEKTVAMLRDGKSARPFVMKGDHLYFSVINQVSGLIQE